MPYEHLSNSQAGAAAAMVLACTFFSDLNACTGISFTAKDGSFVLAGRRSGAVRTCTAATWLSLGDTGMCP